MPLQVFAARLPCMGGQTVKSSLTWVHIALIRLLIRRLGAEPATAADPAAAAA